MGAEFSLCSRFEDFNYDSVSESPAAYVGEFRRIHMADFMAQQASMRQVNTDDMTIDELRAYYDAGGKNRLRSMDSSQQEDLFKKFIVSKSILSITQLA